MILTNPITKIIEKEIDLTRDRLLIAVPFITNFALKVLDKDKCSQIKVKKLITRFDESNINTFNIPVLQYLLKQGFEISYNNDIHLKVYLFDKSGILSSSNLTQSGFEKAIEISCHLNNEDSAECVKVFDGIWNMDETSIITPTILEENINAYKLLNRKSKPITIKKDVLEYENQTIGDSDIALVIKYVFDANEDYSEKDQFIYKSNEFRNRFKTRVQAKIKQTDFYAPVNHPKRNDSFFYQIVYGDEEKLAGTGLREEHFKSVFEDNQLEELIGYIYPPSIGKSEWNFNDDIEMRKFCQGLFDFNIKSYTQVMPVRLASFFYPDRFYPIFSLNHLEEICSILGANINSKDNGERFYTYTMYLNDRMKSIPKSNYIKSSMLYQIKYIKLLVEMREEGKKDSEILAKRWKRWERHLLERAKVIIEENPPHNIKRATQDECR